MCQHNKTRPPSGTIPIGALYDRLVMLIMRDGRERTAHDVLMALRSRDIKVDPFETERAVRRLSKRPDVKKRVKANRSMTTYQLMPCDTGGMSC